MTTGTLVNKGVSETFPPLLQSSLTNFLAGTSTKTTSTTSTTSTALTISSKVSIDPEVPSQMTIKAFDYGNELHLTTETTSTTTTTTTRITYPTRPFKKSNVSQTTLILSLLIFVLF